MDKRKPTSSGKALDIRKRKEPPSGAGNNSNNNQSAKPGRNYSKRVKFQDARNIRSQPADAALDDGKLDLQKFLNAREFEITALENSMRKCKAANSTRTFQQVPRAMRRRTASHNVKRIPKRLRERAKREMVEDNTPTVDAKKRRPRTARARIRAETAKRLHALAAKKRKQELEKESQMTGVVANGPEGDKKALQAKIQTRAPRPKIRRNMPNEPPKQKSKFRKRQINKTWLPTHLWHAKRATMTEPSKPLWRFAVPLTPTEKCYRPTHRASGQKGAVAWDMSYMGTVGLYGTAEGVTRVLKGIGLTQEALWSVRGQSWRTGTRKWTGIVTKQRKDSNRQIGPATIIWNPEIPREDVDMEGSDTPTKSRREVLIRTHPSCFLELFNELLKLVKMQSPQPHVEDLRYEIGSIEITGPASTEALLGILEPYYNTPETEESHGRLFKSLLGVTNPASLPKNALLGFSVWDPRLAYPPKRVDMSSAGSEASLVETLTKWPAEQGLKPFGLFSRDSRYLASQLPPQKSISRRKGSGPPGKAVQVTPADPPIPIILLASRSAAGGHAQGTWTLLAPWNCILPIWYSLMRCPLSAGGNPRLGGLDEVRQVAFEHGTPWFPADFPGTEAGYNWELEQRVKRRQEWDRRPKGKKVEWESLDLGARRKGEIGDGLSCDFEYLFGIPRTGSLGDSEDSEEQASAASVIGQVSKASFNTLVASSNLGKPPANSVVTVQFTLVTRGVARSCARIYRLPSRPQAAAAVAISPQTEAPSTVPPSPVGNSLPSDLRDQWLQQLPSKSSLGKAKSSGNRQGSNPPRMPPGASLETRKMLIAKSIVTAQLPLSPLAGNDKMDVSGHPLCPGEEDLIGFVTTGSFSLSEGKGTAIGSLSAEKALETLRATDEREGRLCIVRNAGESVGWLARWEVV